MKDEGVPGQRHENAGYRTLECTAGGTGTETRLSVRSILLRLIAPDSAGSKGVGVVLREGAARKEEEQKAGHTSLVGEGRRAKRGSILGMPDVVAGEQTRPRNGFEAARSQRKNGSYASRA